MHSLEDTLANVPARPLPTPQGYGAYGPQGGFSNGGGYGGGGMGSGMHHGGPGGPGMREEGPSHVLRLRGLPFSAGKDDIIRWFEDVQVTPPTQEG